MSTPKVWFITGASSGFGLLMAEAALANGDKVVATLRKPEALEDLKAKYPADQLLILKVDVSIDEEITSAFAKTKETFGRVDMVFNNAGYAAIGEIEACPDKEARAMFDTVFWGATNVTRTALPYFREQTPIGGKIFQLSSNFALLGHFGAGYYSAAKAAIEGFSEALVKELDPAWNIKVTLIEPGPFRTLASANTVNLTPHPAYTNELLPINQLKKTSFVMDGDPSKAVKAFLKLAALDEPPFRFPIHRDAIKFARVKAKFLTESADTWESWSEDVYYDDTKL